MCLRSRWLVSTALLLGLVQSVLWIALSVLSSLVYLCVLQVSPYEASSDFFRVTIVKLYFEGPECIPNGTYLGKFNKDYRNPEVLKLFTPDKVFAVMVSYFILNCGYYYLSISGLFSRKPKTPVEEKRFRSLLRKWGFLTLSLCAIDAVFSVKMIFDFMSLNDYMDDKEPQFEATTNAATAVNLAEIRYIPLLLFAISSRFIGVWLWNVIIGLVFLFGSRGKRSYPKDPPKNEQRPTVKRVYEDVAPATKVSSTSVDFLANGAYRSSFDIRDSSDFLSLKRSMEAETSFNTAPKTMEETPKENSRNWSYTPTESNIFSSKPHSSKDLWEMTNEGFADEDQVPAESEEIPDFDHNLENFRQGERKIKIVKPPIGKAVSIPVPPPWPTSGSCNC